MRVASASSRSSSVAARTRCGGTAEEEFAAIREGDVAADAFVGSVARLVADHMQLGADRNGVLRHAAAHQGIRTAAFDHPGDRVAGSVGDVDVNPRMRIDQFDLGDLAAQVQRGLYVELGGKGVMAL